MSDEEEKKVENRAEIIEIREYLNSTLRITISDGRIITGTLHVSFRQNTTI